MRITKKMLREMKQGLIRRVNDLAWMSEESIVCEFERCYAHQTGENGFIPESVGGKRAALVRDAVDRAIPGHWCE